MIVPLSRQQNDFQLSYQSPRKPL